MSCLRSKLPIQAMKVEHTHNAQASMPRNLTQKRTWLLVSWRRQKGQKEKHDLKKKKLWEERTWKPCCYALQQQDVIK